MIGPQAIKQLYLKPPKISAKCNLLQEQKIQNVAQIVREKMDQKQYNNRNDVTWNNQLQRDSVTKAEGPIENHPKIRSEDRKDRTLGMATHTFKKSNE